MKRHLICLTDDQGLSRYRHWPCYYVVGAAAICKGRMRNSAVAAVRDEGVEVIAIAWKDKRLQICEAVPRQAHSQDYGLRSRVPRSQFENAKVRPILGLMEPRSRIETRSEVGPQRSRSVRNVVRPIPDNNPRPIYWRDRLVATPMVQHHIVIYPGHAPPLQAANHSLELRSEARKIVGVLTSAEGLLWVQAVRKIRLCYDSPMNRRRGRRMAILAGELRG
jgi:hypothetical protein